MYTQEEINDGQKKINGQLCRVDWKLVQALRAIRTALAESPTLSRLSLDNVDLAINEADRISEAVADIKPPGCIPELRTEPTWDPVDSDPSA